MGVTSTGVRTIYKFREGDLFDNRYALLKRAGTGGFADVWEAKDTLTKQIVALKMYASLDDDGIAELAQEYISMSNISHPNLLKGNHFATSGNVPYLEMTYCEGGSLAKSVGELSKKQLYHVMHDVLKGLVYLHSENIVHQDIKPENILYDPTRDRYLLSDFGISAKSRSHLSNSVNKSQMSLSMTESYAPPEKFSGNLTDIKPDTKGDIFSLGLTLYELAVGQLPFMAPMATGREMLYSYGKLKINYSRIEDPLLRKVVEACTKYERKDRPTAAELLEMISSRTEKVDIIIDKKEKVSLWKRIPKWVYFTFAGAALAAIMLLVLIMLFKGEPDFVDISGDGNVTMRKDSDDKLFDLLGVEFRMVFVKGGKYDMGAQALDATMPNYDTLAFDDESPVHSVPVSDFYLGETEVTQALWTAVMGNNPSHSTGDLLPVESVSFDDVMAFLDMLNSMTGLEFRLPTEEEWEFAARGGIKGEGHRYSGGDDLDDVAWYSKNSDSKTHAVAQKLPNELGLYDMSGNVWEWCINCWRKGYNNIEDCSNRVLRGGGCSHDAKRCRVTNHSCDSPVNSYFSRGFRLALSK